MDVKTKGITMPDGNTHIFIPPSPTQTERGGVIAKKKTTETVEVAVGEDDKLYVPGTDNTLTDETKAANAKATGDKISELKNNIDNLIKDIGTSTGGNKQLYSHNIVIESSDIAWNAANYARIVFNIITDDADPYTLQTLRLKLLSYCTTGLNYFMASGHWNASSESSRPIECLCINMLSPSYIIAMFCNKDYMTAKAVSLIPDQYTINDLIVSL